MEYNICKPTLHFFISLYVSLTSVQPIYFIVCSLYNDEY